MGDSPRELRALASNTALLWMTGASEFRGHPIGQRRNGDPMFNYVDYIILFVFMAIVGFGFFSGIAKVLAAIVAIYFSAVLAATFYRPTTDALQQIFSSMSQRMGELVVFVVLFLVFSAVFTWMAAKWTIRIKMPRRAVLVDNLGGVALGLVLSAMTLTFAAMFLTIVLQALNHTVVLTGSGSVLGFARGQIRDSTLLPQFLRMVPVVTGAISPWFPSGIPPILEGAP
jgi:uncharacterized membrane protein required for colicin V production